MMQQIHENAFIARLASFLPRQPAQLNGVQESDAELIRLPGEAHHVLAVTTDAIAEEIETGLYTDPYLIGWMTVMANLSDLAAVGADPIGLLVAETLPRDASEEDLIALQTGIRDACARCGTSVLGGDTNFSDSFRTTGTAVGLIANASPLMRVRCTPGEVLFCTGRLGTGNAYAARRLTGIADPDPAPYRPVARLKEGLSLRSIASACMDSSDGLFATLDQLGRLNNCGFELENGWEDKIASGASRFAASSGLDPWMLFAGPHGEFELVFTVPELLISALHRGAAKAGWTPLRLGKVTRDAGIGLGGWGHFDPDDLAAIRNHPLTNSAEVRSFPRFLSILAERCRNSTKR